MTRQLNPGIFGDSLAMGGPMDHTVTNRDTLSFNDDGPFLTEEFLTLRADLERLTFETQEASKSGMLRTEKIIQRLQLFEERLAVIQKESRERWSDLTGKIRERSINDSKVEALIERHNQIVQSFELRISQAQRLIDNQSMQLSKQQQMIDDSRRQIEKLKKL